MVVVMVLVIVGRAYSSISNIVVSNVQNDFILEEKIAICNDLNFVNDFSFLFFYLYLRSQ